jgi:hypothetical protein
MTLFALEGCDVCELKLGLPSLNLSKHWAALSRQVQAALAKKGKLRQERQKSTTSSHASAKEASVEERSKGYSFVVGHAMV